MVSVSLKNWCVVFCFLVSSLYYVNAFRLIQNEPKNERRVTTDVKEQVKKLNVLKDEVISYKDTYSNESIEATSDDISIDIDEDDTREDDEEEDEELEITINEETEEDEDDDDDNVVEIQPKLVTKILPTSAKKIAKEENVQKEKLDVKVKPVGKVLSKKINKEETEEDEDDEDEIEDQPKLVTKVLPTSAKKIAKEENVQKEKLEVKVKPVSKVLPKKINKEETEEDADDEDEIEDQPKIVIKVLPTSAKKIAKEENDKKEKIEENVKPKKIVKEETEDDDDADEIKAQAKIAMKILPTSAKKLIKEENYKKDKIAEKVKPVTKILPKKMIKEVSEEDKDDNDKLRIVTKILPTSVKKLANEDKKEKIEEKTKAATKLVSKKITLENFEDNDQDDNENVVDEDDDEDNDEDNDEDDDEEEKHILKISSAKQLTKEEAVKIKEKPKVVAKILPASAKKLAKEEETPKPVVKIISAKKVVNEEKVKIVENPATKILSKKKVIEVSEEGGGDTEESEEDPMPVKKVLSKKKVKQVPVEDTETEEIVEEKSWFWSTTKETEEEDNTEEPADSKSWFWSSTKEAVKEVDEEEPVESKSWFWSSTKETEKEDDKEEPVESKSWFWSSTKETEKVDKEEPVESKSWFWSSTKQIEKEDDKEDDKDEAVQGKSWFWSSKNEADDEDDKEEEKSWMASVTNILPALPFGVIKEEVEPVKDKLVLKKVISKKSENNYEEIKIEEKPKPVVKSEPPKKVEVIKPAPKGEAPKIKQPEPPKDKKPPPNVETIVKPSEAKQVVKPVEVKPVQKKIMKPTVTEDISDDDDDSLYFNLPSFSPNFDVIDNEECKKQGDLLLDQLNKHKLWALKMLDATAKIPSGILKGNLNQFGDFDQCLSIFAKIPIEEENKETEDVKIAGKYCLASIDIEAQIHEMKLPVHLAQGRNMIRSKSRDPGHFIPRFSTVRWGLCIPSGCTAEDAEKILEDSIRKYNESSLMALNFDVTVENEQCSVRKTPKKFLDYHPATIATIALLASIAIIVFISTVRDFRPIEIEEPEPEIEITKLEQILMSFSLKRTVKSFLKREPEPDEIECIHGVRALGTFALYIAHKLIPIGHIPFTNKVLLTEISNNPLSVILRLSVIYTDSFLLLSGVLTSYRMSKDMETKGSIPWFGRMVARFIRLTPSLLFVLLYYAYVMEYVGEGPLWNTVVTPNADLCKYNWWQNILYIQNVFPFEDMCANHTHQLALDMQLSLIAPIFVWLLYKRPLLGVTTTIICHAISVILRYYTTMNYRLSIVIYHGISVSQLYRTANMLYASSIHRATPYLAGVGLGVLLRQLKPNFSMNKILSILGWLTAGYFTFWSLYSPSHLSSRTYLYDINEAAQFSALCSLAWAMALSWLIFACYADNEGPLNVFLSSRPMVLLSKISYTMYLTQFIVFFYKVGSLKTPTEFHISSSFDIIELITVVIIAILLTLFVDMPVQKIKSILFKPSPKPEITSEPSDDTEKPIENHKSSKEQTPNNKLSDSKQLSLSQESVSQLSDDQAPVKTNNKLSHKHHQLSSSQDSVSQLSDIEDHNSNNVRVKKVQWKVTQQFSEESVGSQLSDTEDNSLNLQPPKNKFRQQLSEESIGSQLSDTEDNSMNLDVPKKKWTDQESLESIGSQFSEDESSINLESPRNKLTQQESQDSVSSLVDEEDSSTIILPPNKLTRQKNEEAVDSQLTEHDDSELINFWSQQDDDESINLQPPKNKFTQQESQESVGSQSGDNEDESTDSSTPKSSKWTATQQASQESVSQLSEDEDRPSPINPPIKPPRIRWSVSKQSSDEESAGRQLSDSEDQGEVVVQTLKINLKAAPKATENLSESQHLSGSQESVNSQKSDWMLTESLSESLHLSDSHESINAEELLED